MNEIKPRQDDERTPKKIEWSIVQYKLPLQSDDEIEGIFIPTNNPKALIVHIHGYNRFGAWEMFWSARRLANAGYAVLLPSQRGFGGSNGVRDYCGPGTAQGIQTLVEHVRSKQSDVRDLPVFLWGISRGAIVGGTLLGHYPNYYTAGALQAGAYDLTADYMWEQKDPAIKQNIYDETGGTEEALRERSTVHYADFITTPVLIIHGKEDETIHYHQAEMLASALPNTHKLVLLDKTGHRIPGDVVFQNYIQPFFEPYTV